LRQDVQVSIVPAQVLQDDLQSSQVAGLLAVASINTAKLAGHDVTQVLSSLFKILPGRQEEQVFAESSHVKHSLEQGRQTLSLASRST